MPRGRGTNRGSFSNSGTIRTSNHPRGRGHGRGRGRGRGRGYIHENAISRRSSGRGQQAEPSTSKPQDQPMDNQTESENFLPGIPIHPERLGLVESHVEDGNDDPNSDMDPVLDAISSRAPIDASSKFSQLDEHVDDDEEFTAVEKSVHDPNSREKVLSPILLHLGTPTNTNTPFYLSSVRTHSSQNPQRTQNPTSNLRSAKLHNHPNHAPILSL